MLPDMMVGFGDDDAVFFLAGVGRSYCVSVVLKLVFLVVC